MRSASRWLSIAALVCGPGNSLRWFADQVGGEGEVIGVDFSAKQLAIAKARAEAVGYRNVRFVEASVYETGLPRAAFDIVHCRFVLCHLTRPMDALREMVALAKPGGLVIVFDVDCDGILSVPPTAGYARARDLFIARATTRGTDCRLGPKLPRMFLAAALPEPEIAIVHPIYLRGERKRLWEHTLLEGAPYMIEKGICTQTELDRIAADLASIAADETIAVAQAAMPVTWARKPI